MYAMHYAVNLPADYDMTIIRERIASKAPVLDNLPGLGLKAYMIRQRGHGSSVNQYATFYLWARVEGMAGFLWGGSGFGSIVSSFGRPPVRHWTGAGCFIGRAELERCSVGTIREDQIAPDGDPATAVAKALAEARDRAAGEENCLAAVAVDPQHWRIVQFGLWTAPPREDEGIHYEVRHISKPEIGAILTSS